MNWLHDTDTDLFDVVQSKCMVPPEEIDILDIVPGTVCKVAEYFRANLVSGQYLIVISSLDHINRHPF